MQALTLTDNDDAKWHSGRVETVKSVTTIVLRRFLTDSCRRFSFAIAPWA